MGTPEHFLVLTNNYQKTWVALFDRFQLLDSLEEDNKKISKQLFLDIDTLLKKNGLSTDNLFFLGCNQGPGPFTTLRSIIASLNGLAFASKKPLVGVNGIQTFVDEQYDQNYDYTVVLNNAFCNDVYYAILNKSKTECMMGCVSFDEMIKIINNVPDKKIKLVGSIVEEKKIELGDRITKDIFIPEPCPTGASLEAIGKQAYQQWLDKQNVVDQLLPLYFKDSSVKLNG